MAEGAFHETDKLQEYGCIVTTPNMGKESSTPGTPKRNEQSQLEKPNQISLNKPAARKVNTAGSLLLRESWDVTRSWYVFPVDKVALYSVAERYVATVFQIDPSFNSTVYHIGHVALV